MRERGLATNRELVRHLGVSESIASRWRMGFYRPGRENCGRVADAFGRPVGEVLRAAGCEG
jgi:hypothetical protein